MKTYFYQAPFTKSSTKSCEIKDADGVSVGSVQRYFNSSFHRLIDKTIGQNNLIVRVKAMNRDGTQVIDAYTKAAMIKKPDYFIQFLHGKWKGETFQAKQINHMKIDAEFLIKSDELEIISKQTMLDWVRFYENGIEIARWRSRAKEKYKTYIEIEENASVQDPLFYAVVGQLMYFIGY